MLTAFLLSRPRKKSNIFLLGFISAKHLASHKSRLGTYGRIRSFSRKTCPGLYLKEEKDHWMPLPTNNNIEFIKLCAS